MGQIGSIYTGFEAHLVIFSLYSHIKADIKYETVEA